jgi:SAM-dependent methyltransferase
VNDGGASNLAYYEQLAKYYSLFFADLEGDMQREGAWLDSVLRGQGVRTVLDASCGAGRQAIPLIERGYDVTATDPSTKMLDEAGALAIRHGVRIDLRQAAFRDLDTVVDAEFDAVIALGNGLCNQEHLDEIEASLRVLRSRCRRDGLCLIGIKDYASIRASCRRFHGHRVADEDGTRLILFEVWEIEEPVLCSTAFLLKGCDDSWSVTTAHTREYMLEFDELEHASLSAGFRRVERLDHPSEAVYLLR